MSTYSAEHPHDPQHDGLAAWLIRVPVLMMTGAIVLLTLLTIFAGAAQLAFRDRILAGVSSFGVDLGGMTPAEATEALRARFTYDQSAIFTFRDGDRFWQLSAGELGVHFDPQAAAAEAFVIGHSANPILNVVDQALIWLNGYRVTPIIRYDQNVAVERLMAIAEEINRPPVNATLRIDGLEVRSTPSQIGRLVNIPATLAQLETAIRALTTGGEARLVIEETAPRIRDAEAAAAKARAALSAPLVLVAEGTTPDGQPLGPWFVPVERIAALLTLGLVENGDGTYSYDVSFNPSAFRDAVEMLRDGLFRPAQNARFEFVEETGQLQLVQPAVDERRLNVPATLARMESQVFDASTRLVPIVFDYTLARYHNNLTAAELGITELVAQGTSSYAGSSRPRIENILLSMSRFNGLIIAPGEEFSFNRYVGDISPEEGFVPGRVIFGGRTIEGVGGGVCQVSTTAFRAAFAAGYPITMRYAHGYRVGYYEQMGEGPGMDAAIYVPGPTEPDFLELDFRFVNDTPYHLLIETSVFPGTSTMQFRFYSTNPGRQVVKDGPIIRDVVPPLPTRYEANADLLPGQQLQVDVSAEGGFVQVTRIILDNFGNEIGRQDFRSQYQPWGAIVQVAPGDPRLSQSG